MQSNKQLMVEQAFYKKFKEAFKAGKFGNMRKGQALHDWLKLEKTTQFDTFANRLYNIPDTEFESFLAQSIIFA